MNLEKALEKIAALEEEVKRYKEIEKRYIEMTGAVIPCGQEFDSSSFPELKASYAEQVLPDSKLIFEHTQQLVNDCWHDPHPINRPAPILLPDWDGNGRKNKNNDD